MRANYIFEGDVIDGLRKIPDASVNCCVTSPPYWGLRDYGVAGQRGLEPSLDGYVSGMVSVFAEVRRVLRSDGTLWLNIGDTYNSGGEIDRHEARENPAGIGTTKKYLGTPRQYGKRVTGLKPKDMCGIPWRTAFALQADGWYLRSDIIWHKPCAMPESVTDRPTKAHEYVFLFSKSPKYYYDADSIREPYVSGPAWIGRSKGETKSNPDRRDAGAIVVTGSPLGRNRRTVWAVSNNRYRGAHFATFPPRLIEPCILAGCPVGGIVLDPFMGSGTTAAVAIQSGRRYIGCELNPAYIELANARISAAALFSARI